MPLETTRKHREWTKEEDDILREYYPTEGRGCISRLERRTSRAIGTHASQLGILVTRNKWNVQELAILYKYYPIEGHRCSRRLLGRTSEAIHQKAVKSGIKRKYGFKVLMCAESRSTEDLTGRKFGRLSVIKFGGFMLARKGKKGKGAVWICRCNCGKVIKVRASSLKNRSNTKSCGCLRVDHLRSMGKQNTLEKGVAASRGLYSRYKKYAKRRNQVFELSFAEAMSFFKSCCAYCGLVPMQIYKAEGGNFQYNGIDRIDNDKGYSKNNCVACCWRCNRAKYMGSIEDFQSWVERAYNHMFKKGLRLVSKEDRKSA